MPTLSLSIIVGPGRASELERCLKSVQGPLFDEIVVTLTAEDKDVERVAKTYASKTPFFQWCDDFSAARNFCLSHCTSSHWAWIDSDDVIPPEDYKKLLDLKPNLDKHEVIWLKYVYSRDSFGNPETVLPRERILPNNGKFSWIGPIHECVYPQGSITRLDESISISHMPIRRENNFTRNLRILEKEWEKPTCSDRMKFYYARDLTSSGNWDKGEKIALDCINNEWVFGENKASLCRNIVTHYYESKVCDEKLSEGIRERYRDQIVRYCLIGINAYCRMAELWTFLGIVAYDRSGIAKQKANVLKEKEEEAKAILYFETAMGCLREAFSGSRSQYYSEVPARNLYMIYHCRGEFSKALIYNKVLIELDPGNVQAKQNRDLTWEGYWKAFQVQPIPDPDLQLGHEETKVKTELQAVQLSVAWLIPHINLDDPATRIRRVNISDKLEQLGVDSSVIHGYHNQSVEQTLKEIRDAKVCVFTQFTDRDLELIAAVKKAGKKVLLDSCEAIFGIPGQREAWSMADKVVCCSTKLADMHKEKGLNRVAVVQDAAEVGF